MGNEQCSYTINTLNKERYRERQKQDIMRAPPELEEKQAGCQRAGGYHTQKKYRYIHFSPSQMSPQTRIIIATVAVANRHT